MYRVFLERSAERDLSRLSCEVHLLDFWPDPGAYTLRLECFGKNAQSHGYYCGV